MYISEAVFKCFSLILIWISSHSCHVRAVINYFFSNPIINIPSFLLYVISYWTSETSPLCLNLVFLIWIIDFSNKLTHCWLLTSHLPRPCSRSIKNRIQLMFRRVLFISIIGLNFESLFRVRKFRELKIVDLH